MGRCPWTKGLELTETGVRYGALIIPDAYNGLLIYDDFVKCLDLGEDAKAPRGE